MFENIKAHLKPHADGKGGTYFGATGCGKTYTMLFLARMLNQRDRDTFNNPTIIIITDREDLDRQTSELFVSSKKYLHDENVRSIESRKKLHQALGYQSDKGVFTTYGFAKYLRDSFPNATYCGFTGTPIDETIAVFGEVYLLIF